MRYVICDVEADGPAPGHGLFSMISFGAVVLDDPSQTFYATLRPMTRDYMPDALAVSGFTREETLTFPSPLEVMPAFDAWLKDLQGPSKERLLFVSDNAGFDWQFINHYLWKYVGENRFGFSPCSLTWLYKGFERSAFASFKHLRKTRHSHHALDDARGNAEALQAIIDMGFKIGK